MNKKDIEKIIDKEANKFAQKDFTEKILNEYKNDRSEMIPLEEKKGNKKKIWLISIPSAIAIAVAVILIIIFNIKDINDTSDNSNYTNDLQLLNFAPKNFKDNTMIHGKEEKAIDVDVNYGDDITLVATVKNLQRFSFIDIVIYREDLNTLVVYNEGNGDYVCKTNTVLENDIWVTLIEIDIKITSQFPKNGTIYVDDINFISSDNKHFKADITKADYVKVNYNASFGTVYNMYSNTELTRFFRNNLNSNNENVDNNNDDYAQINIRYSTYRTAKNITILGTRYCLYGFDDIDLSNYSFVFEDGYNPFDFMTSKQYLKNKKYLNKYEGGYYIPSLTNPYYALAGFYDKTKKIHNDTEYFSCDLSVDYDASYFVKEGNKLVLQANNNSKYVIENEYAYKNNDGVITDLKGMDENITDLEFNIEGAKSISIAAYAFYNYAKLTSVNLDKVIKVESCAFDYTAITELLFTDSIKVIDMFAIKMPNLVKMSIPDTIEKCNFNVYEVDNNFQFIEEGNSKYIGNDNNPYLISHISDDIEEVEISNSCKFIYMDPSNTGIDIYYDGSLNDYISNIKMIRHRTGNGPRYNLYYLDSNGEIEHNSKKYSLFDNLIIPDGVKYIDDYQFSYNTNIKNIIISDNVTNIGKYAFKGIYSIDNLVIGSNLKYVDCNAFESHLSIGNLYYNGDYSDYAKIKFEDEVDLFKIYGNVYILDSNGSIEYMGKKYSKFDTSIIPEGTI